MKTVYTKTSNTRQEVEIELSFEEFNVYLDKVAKDLSKNLNVPGFRKGNIPTNIAEQNIGSDVLYNETAEIAMQGSYGIALDGSVESLDEDINGKLLKDIVSGLPRHVTSDVHVVKIAPDNPFIFKIQFIVPYFDIAKNYKELAQKVATREKKEVTVEDSEVNDTLEWLRKNHRAKQGEAPNDVENQKNLPELNDDFAKTVGDFANMQELRKSIYEGIHIEKGKKEKDRVIMSIIKEIADKSEKEIPKEVVEKEVINVENEFKENISGMGLEFEDYIKKINKKREDFKSGWEDSAKERVETALVLDAIADKENIKPSDEEVKEEAQKILARYGDIKKAEESIDPQRLMQYVYNNLRNEKVLEFLEKNED